MEILLGVRLDRRSVVVAQNALGGLGRMAMGLASAFGVAHLGKALLGMNASIESSKNQIAGMLALAKNTAFSDELKTASGLYDGLRKKAAELPGSTQQYVDVLSRLVQPLASAGLDVERMENMTVRLYNAATGLGEPWQAATRDIAEFINFGKMNKVDKFLRTLVEPSLKGHGSDAERKEMKTWSKARRAALIEQQLNRPAITALMEAQAKSFTGSFEKVKERIALFLAKIGEGLFNALKPVMKRLDTWFANNADQVEAFAVSVGDVLVAAFGALQTVIEFLVEHGEFTKTLLIGIAGALGLMALRATALWLATLGPFAILVGAIMAGYKIFDMLRDKIGDVGAALVAAFATYQIFKAINAIKSVVTWMWALKAAAGGGKAGIAGAASMAMQSAVGARARGQAALAAASGAAIQGPAGAAAFAAGTGARGAGAAAAKGGLLSKVGKIGGTAAGIMGGPIGWGILAGITLGEMAPSIDERAASGERGGFWGGPIWDALADQRATANVPANANVAGDSITVNPGNTTITIQAKDMDDAMAKMAKFTEEQTAAQLRAAQRASAGNRK